MTAKTPELVEVSAHDRHANGYAIIGEHGHGRVVIRVAASHSKELGRFHAVAVRVLVEHDTFIARLTPSTAAVSARAVENVTYTRARLEQFVRDAYADLVARHLAGDPTVADLFAPLHPREQSDAVTLLGDTGWRGNGEPVTLSVQDDEDETCGARDSDECCSCSLPVNHEGSCVFV